MISSRLFAMVGVDWQQRKLQLAFPIRISVYSVLTLSASMLIHVHLSHTNEHDLRVVRARPACWCGLALGRLLMLVVVATDVINRGQS